MKQKSAVSVGRKEGQEEERMRCDATVGWPNGVGGEFRHPTAGLKGVLYGISGGNGVLYQQEPSMQAVIVCSQ